ncbi:MerR family transcriptional regulator, partial [Ectothiorhodospira sp. 9100]
MKRLVSIGEAAKALGVSITTLRRWEASGRLVPEHTAGGHRRYD